MSSVGKREFCAAILISVVVNILKYSNQKVYFVLVCLVHMEYMLIYMGMYIYLINQI